MAVTRHLSRGSASVSLVGDIALIGIAAVSATVSPRSNGQLHVTSQLTDVAARELLDALTAFYAKDKVSADV